MGLLILVASAALVGWWFYKEITILPVVLATSAVIAMLFGSHIAFHRNVEGVLTAKAAADLGLIEAAQGPFGAQRVWFAPDSGGGYIFRSAYPLFGSMPFDFFGNGSTALDLKAKCAERQQDCKLLAR